MAKSGSKSFTKRGLAGRSSRSSAAAKPKAVSTSKVAKAEKGSASGNGKHSAEQAELALEAEAETPVRSGKAGEPSAAKATEAAASAPAPAANPPAMRELGLTAKDAWKVDLRGKRVVLDEKEWREELARALGRVPAKA